MADPIALYEGGGAHPASFSVQKTDINGKPAFMEIKVTGPSKDRLTPGPTAAILIPLKVWEDILMKLMT